MTLSPIGYRNGMGYDRRMTHRVLICLGVLVFSLFSAVASAAPVTRLQVRIVTGNQELAAGSDLELRIYETGRGSARRLPLVHGETWLPESTHLIPLRLDEALEPRNVIRFALYYRAANVLAPPLEILSADVETGEGTAAAKLLNTTLSGVIARQGELASVESNAGVCASDADCDDHKSCNGHERCAPRMAGADARGCVKGSPVACPVNEICGEGVGCVGVDGLRKFNQPPAGQPR